MATLSVSTSRVEPKPQKRFSTRLPRLLCKVDRNSQLNGPRTNVRLRLRPGSVGRFPTMDAATGYSAPIHALLVEIREPEEAGLVAVSIDEGAEFRVELTSRGQSTWVAIRRLESRSSHAAIDVQ